MSIGRLTNLGKVNISTVPRYSPVIPTGPDRVHIPFPLHFPFPLHHADKTEGGQEGTLTGKQHRHKAKSASRTKALLSLTEAGWLLAHLWQPYRLNTSDVTLRFLKHKAKHEDMPTYITFPPAYINTFLKLTRCQKHPCRSHSIPFSEGSYYTLLQSSHAVIHVVKNNHESHPHMYPNVGTYLHTPCIQCNECVGRWGGMIRPRPHSAANSAGLQPYVPLIECNIYNRSVINRAPETSG